MTTTQVAIDMRQITKRFAGVTANDHVDFEALFGEVHALIGENGAGKSTLMAILAGLYRPDGGTMAIAGEPVEFRAPRDAISRGIGMVHQHFMLVETFTVAENCLLGLDDRGMWLDTTAVESELRRLSMEYGLDVDPTARIWQLSVGEQQRVEILRLLFRGARILVLDEPTAVLTPQEATALITTLRSLAGRGFCVIFISHKLDEVMAVSDRVTIMRRGKAMATVATRGTNRAELARMMVGRELAAFVEHPADEGRDHQTAGDVVLAVTGLEALGEKGLPALRGVDLTVRAGEILGVAGVAGNGQRELAEVITGLRRATAGNVEVAGETLTNRHPAEIARAGVAHVPEDRLATGLIGAMAVSDNSILRDYFRSPIAKGPFLANGAISRFTDGLIDQYDVKTPSRRTRVRLLSGGNQQKLLLGRELSGQPRVIVAVHPTRGVDVGATEAIHDLLDQQKRRGAGILLISEDLDELIALSDRIAVMYEGSVTGTVAAQGASIDEIGLLMAGVRDGATEAVRG